MSVAATSGTGSQPPFARNRLFSEYCDADRVMCSGNIAKKISWKGQPQAAADIKGKISRRDRRLLGVSLVRQARHRTQPDS